MQPLEELVDLAADAAGDAAEIVGHRLAPRRRWRGCLRSRRRRRLTSSAVSTVRLAAISTLRAISCVAAPCSVTAAAMAPLISPISRMVRFDRRRSPRSSAWWRAACRRSARRSPRWRGGLAGQRLDLAGHHRKAAAGLAGARRLDGGVERQQIGLLGDVGDELDHVADALGRLVELLDRRDWCARPRSTAFSAMAFDCATWRSISLTEADSSSAAEAMSRTLAEASAEAAVARAVLARGVVGGAGKLGRGRQHLIGDAAELGERRFDLGGEARDLGRHLLLALRARFGVVAHGAVEFVVVRMACWNTPIERASAPISSRRVAVRHRDRRVAAGDLLRSRA